MDHSADMPPDEDILSRLLALNLARSEGSRTGCVGQFRSIART